MGYIGTKPADAALTTSDLGNNIVTAAKLATDAVETAKVKDINITTAKIKDLNVTAGKLAGTQDLSTKTITLPASVSGLGTGITNSQLAGSIDVTSKITGTIPTGNLGSGTASSSTYLAGDQSYKALSEYDDNVVQSNIAMLGFKVATNGSLTRYNLVDQSIDEYNDTTGVDASASTNEFRSSAAPYYYYGATSTAITATEDADDSGVDGTATWYKWTDTGATGSYEQDVAQSVDFLVVAGGGGGGGADVAGGGGAGGLRTSYSSVTGGGCVAEAQLALGSGTTYTMTIGVGGTASTGWSPGLGGAGGISSFTGSDITDITTVGGGGGRGYFSGGTPNGGSGAGGGDPDGAATSAGTGTSCQGYAGGAAGATGGTDTTQGGGGGGGASGVGSVGITGNTGGDGGAGLTLDITGTDVGYGGGGGGSCFIIQGQGTQGGGNGGGASPLAGEAGGANTGGGAGGKGGGTPAPVGGTGVVILRRETALVVEGDDLTLQSTDVTAEAEPDFGELVTLIENAAGTATLKTDIKGYVSCDSGATFAQGTLADEGTWGTNKQILGFHDLDISSQTGTSMCYKITTHNQGAGKKTRVYATSIGWR